jgi:hypothetical protein
MLGKGSVRGEEVLYTTIIFGVKRVVRRIFQGVLVYPGFFFLGGGVETNRERLPSLALLGLA